MTCCIGWKPVTNYQEDAWQVGISGLRIFWHLVAWSYSKWCTCWIIVFSFNLCCHCWEISGSAAGTSCFKMRLSYKVPCLQACNIEAAGKTIIQWLNEISWVRNKGFYKSGNRTTRNPQKTSLPCFDPLTCCSCFLPDPIMILTFFMNWRSRCFFDDWNLSWSWRNFHKHHTIAEHMDLVK